MSVPSLYLHLPFCLKKCAYCAFYSEPRSRWEGALEPYTARLVREISLAREEAGGNFDTVYVGGGTPSCAGPENLRKILSAAGRSRETTVEINPETLTDDFAPLFAEGLVTRVSMGIQSLSEKSLALIGRNASLADNLRGIRKLEGMKRNFGFAVNYDLITCLPEQTLPDAVKDVDGLLSLAEPEHVSLYCLTLEPGTPLAEKKARVPDSDRQADMLYALWDHLEERGYEHYEISNFARDGRYCRHNLHYWHLDDYVGLGSHAAGRMREGGRFSAWENTQSLSAYAAGAPGSGYRCEDLTAAQEKEEYLLTNLRTKRGIGKKEWKKRFGDDFDAVFARQIPRIDKSLYVSSPESFRLTRKGAMLLDTVLLALVEAV